MGLRRVGIKLGAVRVLTGRSTAPGVDCKHILAVKLKEKIQATPSDLMSGNMNPETKKEFEKFLAQKSKAVVQSGKSALEEKGRKFRTGGYQKYIAHTQRVQFVGSTSIQWKSDSKRLTIVLTLLVITQKNSAEEYLHIMDMLRGGQSA